MAKDQTYPGANTTAQWFQDNYPGAVMDANCGCLHTTETIGWPGYGGGATAPNMTSKPDFSRKILVDRQHFPVDRSSRALRNLAGGVETNTLNVFQWELIATCDPKHAKTWTSGSTTYKAGVDYVYTPDAPDWWLREIAKRLVWLDSEHAIPAATPVEGIWTPYPKSYANGGGQRFTFSQWRGLAGWCGHQHVPENVHGDPGALDFPRILEHVRALRVPVTPPISPPLPGGTTDMIALIQPTGRGAVYVTDFITKRHVSNPDERTLIRTAFQAATGRPIPEYAVTAEQGQAIPSIDNPVTNL